MLINNESPFYVKLAFKFLVIFFICFFIYAAQNILIPFAFALLFAVLLLPIVQWLERNKFSRVLAIAIAILLAGSVIAGIIYFLSSQIAGFMGDIPSIKQHINEHFLILQHWVKEKFNVSFEEQNEYLNEQADKLRASGTGYKTYIPLHYGSHYAFHPYADLYVPAPVLSRSYQGVPVCSV